MVVIEDGSWSLSSSTEPAWWSFGEPPTEADDWRQLVVMGTPFFGPFLGDSR